MKLISHILLFAIFTMLCTAAEARPKKGLVSVPLHQERSVPGAGIKIKFVEMVEDSRCPEGTSCVWAGNARVKIEVRGREGSKTFQLNSNLKPTVVDYGGYQIKLAALTPRPAVNIRIDPDKYLASFEVVKAK